ncbi:hypothetical protein MRB53_042331 [Persea americana]|nr:hypothetical protein MRB53_042331 [Persea americana]
MQLPSLVNTMLYTLLTCDYYNQLVAKFGRRCLLLDIRRIADWLSIAGQACRAELDEAAVATKAWNDEAASAKRYDAKDNECSSRSIESCNRESEDRPACERFEYVKHSRSQLVNSMMPIHSRRDMEGFQRESRISRRNICISATNHFDRILEIHGVDKRTERCRNTDNGEDEWP